MYQDELYHHGILGQKWGVRRFQNKDGTRTAAGKKRYSGPFASIKKAKANRKRNKALKKARKTREKNRAEKQDLEANKKEWAKNPKSLSEHFDEFSNEEITEALTRLDLQKKVANLRQDQIMRGKKYIDMIGDVSKDVINVATMFKTIDATVKALSGEDSKGKNGKSQESKEKTKLEKLKEDTEMLKAKTDYKKAEDDYNSANSEKEASKPKSEVEVLNESTELYKAKTENQKAINAYEKVTENFVKQYSGNATIQTPNGEVQTFDSYITDMLLAAK